MSDLLCNLLDALLHASGKVIFEELGEVSLPAALAGGHVLQVHGPGEGGVRTSGGGGGWFWCRVVTQSQIQFGTDTEHTIFALFWLDSPSN